MRGWAAGGYRDPWLGGSRFYSDPTMQNRSWVTKNAAFPCPIVQKATTGPGFTVTHGIVGHLKVRFALRILQLPALSYLPYKSNYTLQPSCARPVWQEICLLPSCLIGHFCPFAFSVSFLRAKALIQGAEIFANKKALPSRGPSSLFSRHPLGWRCLFGSCRKACRKGGEPHGHLWRLVSIHTCIVRGIRGCCGYFQPQKMRSATK